MWVVRESWIRILLIIEDSSGRLSHYITKGSLAETAHHSLFSHIQTTCQLNVPLLLLLLVVLLGLWSLTLGKGLDITFIASSLLTTVSVLICQPVIGTDGQTLMFLMTPLKTLVMWLLSFDWLKLMFHILGLHDLVNTRRRVSQRMLDCLQLTNYQAGLLSRGVVTNTTSNH